jgi:5-methylcytosine-specific restriction enzyme subunit McrC
VLFDMAKVFEDFVVVALREALRLNEHSFPQGATRRRLRLDEASRVRLRPDLSWFEGKRCVFVGDVKYKPVKVEGILHPDLYQLLAYTIATDLPAGLVVYAAGEGVPVQHDVVHVGKQLHISTLDLSGMPDQILDQIQVLAGRIVTLRQRSITGVAA